MSRRHDSLIPLSHQHQHALALAVIIKRRGGITNDEGLWRREMSEKILKLYAAELAGHFDVEEAILFTEMERYLGRLELVTELRVEHQSLRSMVQQVKACQGETLQFLDEFSSAIESHIRKEERRLFREFEKRMPAAEAKRVGSEIDARLVRICPGL